MKTFQHTSFVRRVTRRTPFAWVTLTATVALSTGAVAGAVATPAGAAGSTANVISASAAPSGGSVRGTYTPSAKATSGDKVDLSLDTTSTGCSLSSGKVTFTAAGTCVLDFNDPGNATYAAAAQVRQSITVYATNVISVSKTPTAASTGGSYSPGATATSGDAVVRSLEVASSWCSLASNKVTFTGSGTCRVEFTDAGNGAFAAASPVRKSIKVYAANVIHPSVAPAAGTVNGTYTVSATATSGDTVTISLDATSSGCSLDKRVVTFTRDGVCQINFNDAGNGAFDAAAQVRQSITVGAGNPLTQAPIELTSVSGVVGHALTLPSWGGSGTGAVSYATTTTGSAGCTLTGAVLRASRAGTCTVTVTKSGDATYASAHSSPETVTFTRAVLTGPHANWVHGRGIAHRTVTVFIGGYGFYGRPSIRSNEVGTRAVVTRDSGTLLSVRVSVRAKSAKGWHTFAIRLTDGKSCRVNYWGE